MSDAKGPACPICGKSRNIDFRPFCSKRCADIDLNRWLTGHYAIPAAPDTDADDDLTAEDVDALAKASGQPGNEPI